MLSKSDTFTNSNEFTTRKNLLNPFTELVQSLVIGKTGKPKLVLSGSNINSFNGCEKYFQFSRGFLNPASPSGHAADVGTCLHEVLQHYVVHKDRQKALQQIIRWYPMKSDDTNSAKTRSLEATYVTANAMIDSFHTKWPTDYQNSEVCQIDINGTLEPTVELRFEIFIEQSILPEFDVYIAGAIDLVMYAPFLDTYFVCDIKTHGTKIPSVIQEKFEFANQCLPYSLVLSQIAEQSVSNFEVLYWTGLVSHTCTPEKDVQIIPYSKNQNDIETFILDFYKVLRKLRLSLDIGFSRNSSHCIQWNSVCRYKDACRISNVEIQQSEILGFEEPADRYSRLDMMPHIEFDFQLPIGN
jgi:hypothetical protein